VLKTNYPSFEIVVADCLTSNIERFMHTSFPQATLVHFDKDVGPAEEHNAGFRATSHHSDYVAFLDNDTEVSSNWLREAVAVMETDSSIGAAQSKLLLMSDPSVIDSAGHYLDTYGLHIERTGRDPGQYDRIEELLGAKGASLTVRRKAFEQVGGYDPSLFIQFDDVDLCWRMWLRGYKVVFAPKSVVYHVGSTTKGSPPRLIFYVKRNEIASMIKNYEIRNLVRFLSGRVIIEVRNVVRLLAKGNLRESFATARALISNLVGFPLVWKNRMDVQYRLRRVSDEQVMKRVFWKPRFPLAFYLLMLHRVFLSEFLRAWRSTDQYERYD